MDGDGPGHGCRCPVLAASGEVASLPAVVLLLHQVVAGAEGNEVSVVRRSRNGDATSAADVSVAQLVRQLLQLVSLEPAQRHGVRYNSQTKSRSLMVYQQCCCELPH